MCVIENEKDNINVFCTKLMYPIFKIELYI